MNNKNNQHPASQEAHKLGITLTQVSRQAGTSTRNLYNWYENRPALFKAVLVGSFFLIKFGKFIEYFKVNESVSEETPEP